MPDKDGRKGQRLEGYKVNSLVSQSINMFSMLKEQGKPVSHFPHVEGMFEEQLMHVTCTKLLPMI